MTLIRPTTKLSEVIAHAQRDKAISVLCVPADIANAQPEAILITAIGYHDIQLLLDAARPVTDIFGFNQEVINLRSMFFNVTMKYPGFIPMQTFVYRNVLEAATTHDRILTLAFEPWYPQNIPASVVIAATGKRNVDLLKERTVPALEKEKKVKEDKPLTGYQDLPTNFIPKGEG